MNLCEWVNETCGKKMLFNGSLFNSSCPEDNGGSKTQPCKLSETVHIVMV